MKKKNVDISITVQRNTWCVMCQPMITKGYAYFLATYVWFMTRLYDTYTGLAIMKGLSLNQILSIN